MAEYACPSCTTRCGSLDFALVLRDGAQVMALCPYCSEETSWTEDWVINYGAPGTDPAPGLESDDRLPHLEPWPYNVKVVNGDHSGQPDVTGRVMRRTDDDRPQPGENAREAEHRLTQSLIAKALNAGEHPIARHMVELVEEEPDRISVAIPVVKRPEPPED